ncbi:Transposase IS200 like protein [compost metagenome]
MPSIKNAFRLSIGRHSEPGCIYLLTVVVDRRKPVFRDWRVGRLVVDQFKAAHEQQQVSSLAWVVMPDHFHWLLQSHDASLAELMCRVKSRSSLAVNAKLARNGRLWQKGYHDRAVSREEDLKAMARYVIANPVRAGLVQRVGDYPLWDATWL